VGSSATTDSDVNVEKATAMPIAPPTTAPVTAPATTPTPAK
jgi:hypothetical protein